MLFSQGPQARRPQDLHWESAPWRRKQRPPLGARMHLSPYESRHGHSDRVEGPAHLLAPFGFLMEFVLHTSVHWTGEQTYVFISSEVPFGVSL